LILPEGEAGETLAALVRQDLAACGIGVTPRFVTADELSGVGAISPVYRREFDLALFAWRGGLGGEPQCQLYLAAETPTEETLWRGSNVTGYNNPAYDAACREALRANPSEVSRAAHREAQRLLAADLPSLPLFHRLHWLVARPAVNGLSLEGIAADELRSELTGIEEIDLNG
jgi:ABC-type transport system substrate-binding protein